MPSIRSGVFQFSVHNAARKTAVFGGDIFCVSLDALDKACVDKDRLRFARCKTRRIVAFKAARTDIVVVANAVY
jgi:hypothetical protein